MIGIKDFLTKINRKPSCMKKVDWSEETGKFGYQRIRSIIMGLEDDELCVMARNYIVDTWCFITKRESDEIVARLNSCLKDRKERIQQNLSKQDYEERVKSPAWKVLYDNAGGENYLNLQKENELLKAKLAKYESNTTNSICQARGEGARTFIEQLIVYAEGEEKNVAREMRIALTTKMANGCIGKDYLSPEYKQRLDILGKNTSKENSMNFNNSVGTVVAHADKITIENKDHE